MARISQLKKVTNKVGVRSFSAFFWGGCPLLCLVLWLVFLLLLVLLSSVCVLRFFPFFRFVAGWAVVGGSAGAWGSARFSRLPCPCCFSPCLCSLGCAPLAGRCSLGCCGGLSSSVPCLGAGRARCVLSPFLGCVCVLPFPSFLIISYLIDKYHFFLIILEFFLVFLSLCFGRSASLARIQGYLIARSSGGDKPHHSSFASSCPGVSCYVIL